MSKILQIESTITDRYQTTIPLPIRESLCLGKRDKITYTIESDGKVFLSRGGEDDPVIGRFLFLLANDIKNNPSHIHSITSPLLDRARDLISDVEIDLDAPLNDKDE